MSSKLPYYPMYADDFDEDPNVLAMNLAEVGLYILALNESWKRGSIPADPAALAILVRRKPAEVKRAWARIRPCWIENGKPGRLINPRQERERDEAQKRYDKAQHAALSRHQADAQAYAQGEIKQMPRTSESGSVSRSSPTSPSPSDNGSTRARVDFETFMHRWCHHRGLKKPQKYLRERAEYRWDSINMGEEELAAALDGYVASDWARKECYPVLGFVKDPHSWISPQTEDPENDIQEIPRVSIVAHSTRDFPGDWNRLVPAAPIEWDVRRSPVAAMQACASDPDFCARFNEVCEISQKIHEARPGEVSWLTFPWILERKIPKPIGWWRVLTDLRKMTEPKPTQKTKFEQRISEVPLVMDIAKSINANRLRPVQERER